MAHKSPQEELAETSARLAISRKYLARDDNPDLDPTRQDRIDSNRILGELGSEQLSPNSAVKAREAEVAERLPRTPRAQFPEHMSSALGGIMKDQPYVALALAGVIGFLLGVRWRV